jgi:hypothetical protein
MEEFVLPVIINGKETGFNARLLHFGYGYKIEVDVDDSKLYFEKDDDGEWRALLTQEDLANNKTIRRETVQAIAECIQQLSNEPT